MIPKVLRSTTGYRQLPWFIGLSRWCRGNESARRCKRCKFNPCVGKIPWRRKWHSTPVFLPGKFHGKRSLEGNSPWSPKVLDMTEWLNIPPASTHTHHQKDCGSWLLDRSKKALQAFLCISRFKEKPGWPFLPDELLPASWFHLKLA